MAAGKQVEKPNRDIVVVLPDIRSAYNTGSFFRTGDAAGISKIYLSGYTAPPPHRYVAKVALGADEHIPWEYMEETEDVIAQLREEGYQLVAVEQTENSVDYREAQYSDKVALIFGNEIRGVSSEVADLCDIAVELPMAGMKKSLNVAVSGGIMLYALAYEL